MKPTTGTKIDEVRSFNRFYTRKIGLLQEGHHSSPYSLTEVRIMYELANNHSSTAGALCDALSLDAGYVSRILSKFEQGGLLSRSVSDADRRQSLLQLTAKGRKVFAPLDRLSNIEVSRMLDTLSEGQQNRLTDSMRTIREVLGSESKPGVPYIIRTHQPGDLGWIVHRHGVLFSKEFGWGSRFEALVAEIAAGFLQKYQQERERCWVAEIDGEIVGSVMLVRKTDTTAKLRLLLVEPKARGLGIGKRLVEECIRFARQSGYVKMTLFTVSVLVSARHIYEQAGFKLVSEEPNNDFGKALTAETWELEL